MSRTTSRTTPSPRARQKPNVATTLLMIGGSAVVLWLVGMLLYTLVRPMVKLATSSAEVRSLEHQVQAKRAERDQKRADLAFAKTPQGSEGIVRGKGYIKADEHAIRVQVIPSTPVPAPVEAPTASGNQRLFWWSLVGAFVIGFTVLFLRWRGVRRRRTLNGTIRTREKVVRGARPMGPAHEEG